MKKDLTSIYAEWRKEIEDHNEAEKEIGGSNPSYGSWDCGESAVREDFSNYADLVKIISFEEMLELENNYEE